MQRLVHFALFLSAFASADPGEPVIDVHVHAYEHTRQGPPPLAMCTPVEMPVWDPAVPYPSTFLHLLKEPACSDPVWSPMSDEELMRASANVSCSARTRWSGPRRWSGPSRPFMTRRF